MTKAKKVLSLVLAVVMVAAMFAFSASAATQNATFTVSVDRTPVTQGEVINVTVNLTTDYYAGPTSVPVYYNPAVFEFVAGSVVGANIFGAGTTGLYSNNDAATGCLKVAFIPNSSAGTATAKMMNGTLFTFQLKAIADGTSDIGLKAEDQKTATNVGGTLYCGAYDSSDIDANPDTVGQAFTINNTTATVGAAKKPALAVKDTAAVTPVIDTVNNFGYTGSVYGIDTLGSVTLDGALAENLTTTLGDEYLRITVPESGVETTGTIIEVLDTDLTTVLETYVFVYFGDIDADGMITSTDSFFAEYYEGASDGIEYAYQLLAGDVDGDGMLSSTDGFFLEYFEGAGEGLEGQSVIAEMVCSNVYEL